MQSVVSPRANKPKFTSSPSRPKSAKKSRKTSPTRQSQQPSPIKMSPVRVIFKQPSAQLQKSLRGGFKNSDKNLSSTMKTSTIGRISNYSPQPIEMRERQALHLLLQRINRLIRKKLHFSWGMLSSCLKQQQSSMEAGTNPLYDNNKLPLFLQTFSAIYRLHQQQNLVQGFTKISFEFKKQKLLMLEERISTGKKQQVIDYMKIKSHQKKLYEFLKKMNGKRFLKALEVPKRIKTESAFMSSTHKISRLLRGIKKDKDEPSESIMINGRHRRSVSEVVDELADRLQKIEDTLVMSKGENTPYVEKKFEPISSHKMSQSIQSECNRCQSAQCMCKVSIGSLDRTVDRSTQSVNAEVGNLAMASSQRQPLHNVSNILVRNMSESQHFQLAYIKQTVYRPVLLEKVPVAVHQCAPPPIVFPQTAYVCHPEMKKDIPIKRSPSKNSKILVTSARSLSKPSKSCKFLKVTVKE